MTPSEIEILIHCYAIPAPHPRKDAPAVKEALMRFEMSGMIEANDDGNYITTDKGAAHVMQLCKLPWPTKAWIGADGKVIEDY